MWINLNNLSNLYVVSQELQTGEQHRAFNLGSNQVLKMAIMDHKSLKFETKRHRAYMIVF